MNPFRTLLIFFSLLISFTSFSQDSKDILIYDRVNNKPISNATCILVLKKDSSLVGFGRTNGLGKVKLKSSYDTDSLQLWILHSKFIESYGSFSYADTQYLLPKNKVLKEVLITTNKAVTISGDTITYVADSFKLQDGANVEALLKKLPGIQVDKDGTIKAYGKKVEKVLVDGDDFFGEDATLATRNLDAKMIDRVELIDDISKKEKSTGVQDDEKVKIINLKLKESAKKGYFGKVTAGYSNTDRCNGGVMANLFRSKFKATAYLLGNNINNNLSWEDRQQFNLGNNWYYDSDLDEWMNNEESTNINTYQVIPRSILSGANISQQFPENSGKIVLGLKRNQKDYNGNQRSSYEQFFGTNSRKTTQLNDVNATTISNNISANFELQLNKNNKISFNNTIKLNQTELASLNTSKILNNDTLLNESKINTNSKIKSSDVSLGVNYELKFDKKGRFFGMGVNLEQKNDELNSVVKTNYSQFSSSGDTINNTLDQNFKNEGRTNTYKLSSTFTEPIYKQLLFLELTASYLNNNHTSKKNTFSKSNLINEDYTFRIDSLSNNYDYSAIVYSEQAKLTMRLKKWTFSGAMKLQQSDMNQLNLDRSDLKIARNFNNFLPSFSINWKYKRNSDFSIRASKSITPPSISQIQPLVNNSSPLNILEGNPNLVPEEKYNFRISNNFWHAISERSLYASINLSLIQKDIVSSTEYLASGVTKQKYIQTDGNYNINGQIYYGFSFKKLGINLNPNISFRNSKTNSFINNIENINKIYSIDPSISVSKEFDSLFSVYINHNYSFSKTIIQSQSIKETNQWSTNSYLGFSFYLPLKIRLGTELNWNYYPVNNAYTSSTSQWIWNADITKSFGKSDNLNLMLQVNDILNQNASVNRFFYGNSVSESISQALTRYVMLTAVWKFKNKTKSGNTTSNDE